MSWLSHRNPAWERFYDQQIRNPGTEINKGMSRWNPSKWRIRGGDGRWHLRTGKDKDLGCCGCGKHLDTEHKNYNRKPVVPGREGKTR
jgi:hypothetical protein